MHNLHTHSSSENCEKHTKLMKLFTAVETINMHNLSLSVHVYSSWVKMYMALVAHPLATALENFSPVTGCYRYFYQLQPQVCGVQPQMFSS